MVNWDPPAPAGWEAGPTITDITERGLLYLAVHDSKKNLHLKPAYFLQYLSMQDISLQSQSQ